ncbi:hypothetical protein [Comamonas sp. JC664]|uniref:hypothetical protein n=1 Tax=Comamonas sp. JC664 TaxID=2801917 RepID=UPI00191D7B57|nr:hypothetical protein [Comamonas sp. JC664]MBL0693787.1 hypothetical protein [Comamonas sp. JC664]
MSTPRRHLRVLAGLLVASMAGCLPREQEPGEYVFEPVEVLRDDCGLLEPNRDKFYGTLQISGRVVRLDFGFLDSHLVGYFLEDGDQFALDGSVVKAAAEVNGQECLLDQVNIHVNGTTQCETQFNGVLRVRYDTRRPDECVCELWMRYEAVKESKRCDREG